LAHRSLWPPHVRYSGTNGKDGVISSTRSGRCATRWTLRRASAGIYHLQATALYRALAQRDNRNRRQVSPAVIARKLMLLDAVLTVPDAEWYATEEDKVALFTCERGIPLRDLPQRVYTPTHRGPETTRYFMHKLPVYLAPDRSVVHFVYLVNDDSGHDLDQFLRDHVRVFSALPAWSVLAVCDERTRPGLLVPRHLAGECGNSGRHHHRRDQATDCELQDHRRPRRVCGDRLTTASHDPPVQSSVVAAEHRDGTVDCVARSAEPKAPLKSAGISIGARDSGSPRQH
jgi:hypothetical protein